MPVVSSGYWYDNLHNARLSREMMNATAEHIKDIDDPREYFAACGFPYHVTLKSMGEIKPMVGSSTRLTLMTDIVRKTIEVVSEQFGISKNKFVVCIASTSNIREWIGPKSLHIAFTDLQDYTKFKLSI